jgi:predicted RNase H-like nuclease (RuvC/YqgF family)
MMELKIKVATHANGYSLAIDKEEFMYYTAESLIEGFSIRVGLERLNTMKNSEIGRLMDATKKGSLAKQLQKEVDALNAQVKDQKKLIAELRRELREMKQKYGEEDEKPVWYSN